MMAVQAGPSSHPPFHMPFQTFLLESASGIGAPTFLSSASGASGASTGGEPFYPSSQANPSPSMSYPDAGFAPAAPAMMNTNNTNTPFDNAAIPSRKRKASSQENERLSKRLSLLNLEQNGNKLYVPVESPQLRPLEANNSLNRIPEGNDGADYNGDGDDDMQLDDTKHKVYIYNLDDELSSSEDGESSADEGQGRLVFLPDIQKHILQNRIPPSVLVNSEGELAGMQLVLYRDPASLSVPEEHDSVRRAIIEARHRLREKQRDEQQQQQASSSIDAMNDDADNAPIPVSNNGYDDDVIDNDPDAMEMD